MEKLPVAELDFSKLDGLITVVTQASETGEVLMQAYANREALELTLSSGYAHYWSRSRRKLWKKGESSGNVQKINRILVDCDADALIYQVQQNGPACHTGEANCFSENWRKINNDLEPLTQRRS